MGDNNPTPEEVAAANEAAFEARFAEEISKRGMIDSKTADKRIAAARRAEAEAAAKKYQKIAEKTEEEEHEEASTATTATAKRVQRKPAEQESEDPMVARLAKLEKAEEARTNEAKAANEATTLAEHVTQGIAVLQEVGGLSKDAIATAREILPAFLRGKEIDWEDEEDVAKFAESVFKKHPVLRAARRKATGGKLPSGRSGGKSAEPTPHQQMDHIMRQMTGISPASEE